MGLCIELTDLRQWRKGLTYAETKSLGISLRDDIIRRGGLDPRNVECDVTSSGLRLVVRHLPQNEEAGLSQYVSDRLFGQQYGFSKKVQSLRTIFKIHSGLNGVITAQKMSMLKDAFENAYGGWQACKPRFDFIVKASNSFELFCKQPHEDYDLVETVLRRNASTLAIGQLKIEGPLEIP